MSQIYKIVWTWWPCGGKTSGMVKSLEEWKKLWREIYVVPEAATFIMGTLGVKPFDVGIYRFQHMVFETIQLFEKIGETYLQQKSWDHKVMFCDRWLLDCAAYIDDDQWKQLLKEYNICDADIYARYDAVINMQSVAENMPHFYTKENNDVRWEDIEWAKILQYKFDILYGKYASSFTKIENIIEWQPISFEQKKINACNAVLHYLWIPESRELEDMFEVDVLDIEAITKHSSKSIIEQYYIRIDKEMHEEERVRKIIFQDCSELYIKTKKKGIGKDRIEIEEKIEKETYELFKWSTFYQYPIQKHRYSFFRDGKKYELDYFLTGTKKGKWWLECEKINQHIRITIPDFLSIKNNVTDDPAWKNANMISMFDIP